MFITYTIEAPFSSALVSLFASRIIQKLLYRLSQNSVKMVHKPQMKSLHCGVNLDHITSALGLG